MEPRLSSSTSNGLHKHSSPSISESIAKKRPRLDKQNTHTQSQNNKLTPDRHDAATSRTVSPTEDATNTCTVHDRTAELLAASSPISSSLPCTQHTTTTSKRYDSESTLQQDSTTTLRLELQFHNPEKLQGKDVNELGKNLSSVVEDTIWSIHQHLEINYDGYRQQFVIGGSYPASILAKCLCNCDLKHDDIDTYIQLDGGIMPYDITDGKKLSVHWHKIKYEELTTELKLNTVGCSNLNTYTVLENNDINITGCCLGVDFRSGKGVVTVHVAECLLEFLLGGDRVVKILDTVDVKDGANSCVRAAYKAYQHCLRVDLGEYDPQKGSISVASKEKIDKMSDWIHNPFSKYNNIVREQGSGRFIIRKFDIEAMTTRVKKRKEVITNVLSSKHTISLRVVDGNQTSLLSFFGGAGAIQHLPKQNARAALKARLLTLTSTSREVTAIKTRNDISDSDNFCVRQGSDSICVVQSPNDNLVIVAMKEELTQCIQANPGCLIKVGVCLLSNAKTRPKCPYTYPITLFDRSKLCLTPFLVTNVAALEQLEGDGIIIARDIIEVGVNRRNELIGSSGRTDVSQMNPAIVYINIVKEGITLESYNTTLDESQSRRKGYDKNTPRYASGKKVQQNSLTGQLHSALNLGQGRTPSENELNDDEMIDFLDYNFFSEQLVDAMLGYATPTALNRLLIGGGFGILTMAKERYTRIRYRIITGLGYDANQYFPHTPKFLEYSINDKVFYKGTISAIDAANAFSVLGFTVSDSTIRCRAGKRAGVEPGLLGDRIAVKEVIECIFDNDMGFVGTNEKEVEASKDMIRHNLQRLNFRFKDYDMTRSNPPLLSQAEILALSEAEEKEKRAKKEKQRLINESFGPIDRSVVEDIINAHEKEQAEIKDNAYHAYQKYVELGSDINRLGTAELKALIEYICKLENKDKPYKHSNNEKRKKRLAECIPSWTSYFT